MGEVSQYQRYRGGVPIMRIIVFWGLYRDPFFMETTLCRGIIIRIGQLQVASKPSG